MLPSGPMRSICAICAIALVCLSGCFLSRMRDAEPVDAGVRDAAIMPRDLGAPAVDAGTIVPTSCNEYWMTLPWCPAATDRAIGQACDVEGKRCGFECCEPGPPIECSGGRWQPLDFAPDCSAVRCAAPTPCGVFPGGEVLGACARGRVCVRPEGLRGGDSLDLGRCVEPAAPIDSCGAAPPGSIVDEPRSCMLCTCTEIERAVQIELSCACC